MYTEKNGHSVRVEIHDMIERYCRRCTARQEFGIDQCEACEVYPSIRSLGERLLTGKRGGHIDELLAKKENLSYMDIWHLLWNGATKKEVAAAVNMTVPQLNRQIRRYRMHR